MPESLVFSHAKILFLVSLLFGALRSIPTHYLNLIILVIYMIYPMHNASLQHYVAFSNAAHLYSLILPHKILDFNISGNHTHTCSNNDFMNTISRIHSYFMNFNGIYHVATMHNSHLVKVLKYTSILNVISKPSSLATSFLSLKNYCFLCF